MEIVGLPAHPLVVHAAVVLTPLAALIAIGFALVPRWRWALRGPLLGLIGLVVAAVIAAYLSGKSYLESNPALETSPVVATHVDRGEVMVWVGLGFGAVAAAAALLLGGPTALASGRGATPRRSAGVEVTLALLTVLASVGVVVWVVLTGDAGARAVWG